MQAMQAVLLGKNFPVHFSSAAARVHQELLEKYMGSTVNTGVLPQIVIHHVDPP